MSSLKEIYKKYKIMPNLQEHQLRVAAVAKMICDNFSESIDERSVILSSLFHDMGNIIKFDLEYFPEFLEPEGLEYWQDVKEEYIEKYGPDEHGATRAIVNELDLPEGVFGCLEATGFSRLELVREDASYEKKICSYADMRVVPHGVVSIEERMEDGRERYKNKKGSSVAGSGYVTLANSLREIESQIFSKTALNSTDITDESIKGLVEDLWNYPILAPDQ